MALQKLRRTAGGGLLMLTASALIVLGMLSGCSSIEDTEVDTAEDVAQSHQLQTMNPDVPSDILTEGTSNDRGFVLDNIYHSSNQGDIHFNLRLPEGYDSTHPAALFITLPGWEGLYFQGIGANLVESFGFTATDYIEDMIVVAPQLNDWGQASADQVIALTEFLTEYYNIDSSRVFIEGFSAGGETLSLVLDSRPDLFTAALHVASKWDGGYEAITRARTPLRFSIGANDSYYGSGPAQEAYEGIREAYRQQGLSDEEVDSLIVLDVRDHSFFEAEGFSDEHEGANLFAYDKEAMGWLFSQRKEQ